MTRILHFFKTYMPEGIAGVERVIFTLAEGATARGMQVDVLSLSDTSSPVSVPIGHHLAHKARLDLYLASTGFSLQSFGRFAELAKSADLIHYHFPWPFMDLVHLLVRPRKPTVLTYHSDIVEQKALATVYAPLMHTFLGRMDAIVATSANYMHTSPVLRRYADKTDVIPIGIEDSRSVQPDEERLQHWRERVGEGFFLFCGVLRYYKGIAYLLDAARHTGLPVVIAGDGPERTLVKQAALTNVIHIAEFSDADKIALLCLCHAFIFPSHLRSEAFGLALAEAAMMGRPMISCEIGTGTSYINVDGVTGLTVPPSDGAALAEAMKRLWVERDMAAAMGAVARHHFEINLNAQAMTRRYLELYDRLISTRKTGW